MIETTWLNMRDTMARHGLSQDCITKLVRRHNVPHQRVGIVRRGAQWMIDRDAMDRVVQGQRIDQEAIGDEWYTTAQVKSILGVGGTTLDAMIGAGRIKRRQVLQPVTNYRINIYHRDEVARAKADIEARKQRHKPNDRWRMVKAPLVKLVQITPLAQPGESDATFKARQSAEYDAAIEQDMPVEVIYRRGLAVRLLHTPYLIDASRNPHCLGRMADREEVETMVSRIESGEITLTAADLPVVRTIGREPVSVPLYNDQQRGKNRVLRYAGNC